MPDKKDIPVNRRYGNYDKYPEFSCSGHAFKGYEEIIREIKSTELKSDTLVLDCYIEVFQDELLNALSPYFDNVFCTDNCALKNDEFRNMLMPDITDDRIFGVMTKRELKDCFIPSETEKMMKRIREAEGKTLIIGVGAAAFAPEATLIHCSVARWESELRFRRGVPVWNLNDENEDPLTKFKICYFSLWRFLDKHKMKYFDSYDYFIDTNIEGIPVMFSSGVYKDALTEAVKRPFRPVPYFDSGVWGGQWMKDVCSLDRNAVNFAWCFDCVPEENSVYYNFSGVRAEMPCLDIVLRKPEELLGKYVCNIYGSEFPIRYDFLDTIEGGNLSLQVHPTKEYIKKTFNMPYTQDESYYILDAEDDACVYLGVKENTDKTEMFKDLSLAQETGEMDVEKYVNKWPAKKHDHFLIPAGTIHCSGKNSMVLEISSTPYIFTFKLWDWGRLGLDGKPRPINIGHGKNVLDISRDYKWTKENLINRTEILSRTDGNLTEKTGLHPLEPLETLRYTYSSPCLIKSKGGVSVMNLVEGEEAVITSPDNSFEPFIVHYAETFIIPAAAGDIIISPTDKNKGETLKTVRTFVREK